MLSNTHIKLQQDAHRVIMAYPNHGVLLGIREGVLWRKGDHCGAENAKTREMSEKGLATMTGPFSWAGKYC
jgi:hypothetical protein